MKIYIYPMLKKETLRVNFLKILYNHDNFEALNSICFVMFVVVVFLCVFFVTNLPSTLSLSLGDPVTSNGH